MKIREFAKSAFIGGAFLAVAALCSGAVLFRSCGTTDDSTPEDWEDTPELVWYEFA